MKKTSSLFKPQNFKSIWVNLLIAAVLSASNSLSTRAYSSSSASAGSSSTPSLRVNAPRTARTSTAGPVHNLTSGIDFLTIQSAIDAATTLNGHTISVDAGVYQEALAINKSVTLIGPNGTVSPNGGVRNPEAIIDLATGTRSIRILTSNITLKGFEIRNSANAGAVMSGGFSETSSASPDNIVIEKNHFHDLSGNAVALVVFRTTDWTWTVHDNKIKNVTLGTYYGGQYGSGVQLWTGSNSSVTDNVIDNVGFIGIHLGWIQNSNFSGNIISNFANNGIQGFANFNGNVISRNEITRSTTPGTAAGEGIKFLTDPATLSIINNKVTGCLNGIGIPSGQSLTGAVSITNNSLAGNTVGIYHGGTGQLDAPCNWFGSGCLNINQAKFGPVNIATILNSGTDSDLSTNGFQPASGTCVSANTQPPAPTNLACWQTANFNSTTCQWVITGTQPIQPGGSVSLSTPYDISSLPGYGVATSALFNFNAAGGWAGWSVPAGKVVLGAKIISAGDGISDFAVFRPAGPNESFLHYTFGANEYGWVMQAKAGQSNPGVQIEVYYADPLQNYSILPSPNQLNYNGAGGYGGLSATAGRIVSGGGYQFNNSYSSAAISALAVAGSAWPHYTYGTGEQGWVVRGPSNNQPNPGRIYVISFTVTVNQNCWDNYVFNNLTCQWENTGTQPVQPPKQNCWDNYVFNSANCTWVNTGVPGLPVLSTTKMDATCSNVSDGSINLTVTGGVGPFTHVWSPGGATTEDISGLSYGTYSVTTTASNGCISNTTATINASKNAPIVIAAITDGSCSNASDGSINLSVDGVGPFTYAWTPGGAVTEDLNGISSGTYSVSVTGDGGCTTVKSNLVVRADAKLITACPDTDNDGFGDPRASITICAVNTLNAPTSLILDGGFENQAVLQSVPFTLQADGSKWGASWGGSNWGWSSWTAISGSGPWIGGSIARTEDFAAGWKRAKSGDVFGIIKDNQTMSQTFTATETNKATLNWFDANRASWRQHDWFGRPNTYSVTLTDNLGNVQQLGTYTSEVAGGTNYSTPPGGYGWGTLQGKTFWFARTSPQFDLIQGRTYTLSYNSLTVNDDRTTFLDDINISMRSKSSIPAGYVTNCSCFAGPASSTQAIFLNIAMASITHNTLGTTGIGTATGLPAGVTASFANNIITISGTPTESGVFNYSIPLTGICTGLKATGTITVAFACGDGRYAEQAVSFRQQKDINGASIISGRSQSSKALCAPQNNDTENFVSLGFGGDITLKFGRAIRNGAGNDIRVYESTFGNLSCAAYPEKARVFASQDGCRFVYLGEICQDGTLDLGSLNWAQYVRIVDVSSKTADYQSSGTPDGYDVDGIEALNGFETNPVLDPIAGGASEALFYQPGKCAGGANIPVARADKTKATGVHQGTDMVNFVALGFGGKITLRFKYAVENNANGLDLQVVETSYGNPTCNAYPERARFEGSIDGTIWTDLGQLCQDGKLEMGTLQYLHLLRITDESDKKKFSSSADGYDVDGVVAINQCTSGNTRAAVEIVDDINTADEIEIAGIMELYPNPASKSANFTFSSQDDSAYELKIVNSLGQVVYSAEGMATEGANTINLNLEALKPGLHIVQLVKEGSKQQVNLMKR